MATALTVVLVYALNRTFFPVPALGSFLSPYEGFWRGVEKDDAFKTEELTLEGVQAPVQIRFDSLRIPHIFAQNDHDLYFAQGYLTAKDRLWQMEFMTHASAGRLAEIIGPQVLEMDRYQRRMGMLTSAKESLARMQADPNTNAVLEAYTEGVNAYISQLQPRDYPFEYKLLNYAPEKYTPLKVALLLKRLALDMTGYSDDLRMTNTLRKYGPEVVKDLFPDYPFKEEPIIPMGTKPDFTPLTVPPAPPAYIAALAQHTLERQKPENLGSNNWAVTGNRTASGYPLLASDPHLGLSLPSIWYVLQLHAPGVNAYGVTIPGAPGVGIGFNEQIAWGMTNVGSDVLDWYQITFKDNSRREYKHGNQWKPVRRVVEKIAVKGQALVLDTVLYTHHGPVVYLPEEEAYRSSSTPTGHAIRWTAHDNQNELHTLYAVNRARSYSEFREALRTWAAPAFNFVYADSSNIAIVSNGLYPLKWQGQGNFLLDGANPAHDWQGWIPMDQVPAVFNPSRGFVSSANQVPVHPQDYPYYLGSSFAGYERSARINQRLTAMTQATPDSFRVMQTDNFSFVPKNALPTLLALVQQENLTAAQKKAYQTLASWNYRFDPELTAPTLFEEWWQSLARAIWSDEFPAATYKSPSRDRLVQLLLNEPQARWYDNVETPQKETLTDLVNTTFLQVADSMNTADAQWKWGHAKNSSIKHLGLVQGLGHTLNTGGSANSINALNGSHGPSWRMVVQLGPTVKAWGVYPGGQSGNPGSRFYDNLLQDWQAGQLHELLFLRNAEDRKEKTQAVWVMKGK